MMLTARVRSAGAERGSIMWALLVSMILMVLGTIFTASVIMTVHRSKASTDAMMLTQYTDTAVADAVAKLNANTPVAARMVDSVPHCEKVASRSMCYRYWAMPVPGSALDPVRYDLVARVWVDNGTMTEPAGGLLVRSSKLPLEVITYQTAGGQGPSVTGGYVAYNPTPSGLFANAIHSFTSSTLEGPDLSVKSYNSQTGDTGTGNGTVSSSGWLSFGTATQADRTVLYGGASSAGDHTSRCTGEACVESGTRVVQATYAAPTDASVAWMRDPSARTQACATTISGDYVTSEHAGQLPIGVTCIDGSLIVDATTTVNAASPITTLYVNGTVQILSSLNAPGTGTLASPATLVIYSTGASVSFSPPDGTGVSAMIYAPLAVCGTDPANASHITFFGSLVCGTISIAGHWEQLYDDAATAEFTDPVVGSAKTFAPGVPSTVGFNDFLVPSGWVANTCAVPSPSGAAGYWKLDGAAGFFAQDSSGSGLAAGWKDTTAAGRADGVCDKAAVVKAGGAVIGGVSKTAINGLSLEYWANSMVGNSVTMAGVRIDQDSLRHVTVTVGSSAVRIPFSVENYPNWHLYTVTVSPAGVVSLYVDGALKGTGSSGTATSATSGPLTIGNGSAGAIDEVVYYDKPLDALTIASRFDGWNTTLAAMGAPLTTSSAGVPFSVPGTVTDGGSGPSILKVNWTKPTGDFPTADPTTSYRVETGDAAGGPFSTLGTALATATAYWQSSPPVGAHYYRVCAIYNGDTKCSTAVKIITLDVPAAPVLTLGAVTTTTAVFNWTAPQYAATYQSQYSFDGGAWVLLDEGTNLSRTHGPTTQGSTIAVQVRAINAAGTGPWSSTVTATLRVDIPTATGWITGEGNTLAGDWSLHSRLTGVYCPAGTTVQSQLQDQPTNAGATWNPWGAWGWTDAAANGWTRDHASWIGSYDVGANQLINIKCVNPLTNAESAVFGPHGPLGLWHVVPGPWGSWAGIVAYRTAGWGAACGSQLTPIFQWQVVAAFNTGVQGWTFATTWANTGQGWGSGTVYMSSRCQSPGGHISPAVQSASGGF